MSDYSLSEILLMSNITYEKRVVFMAASALSGAEITKGIWTRENVELLSWSTVTQKRGQ